MQDLKNQYKIVVNQINENDQMLLKSQEQHNFHLLKKQKLIAQKIEMNTEIDELEKEIFFQRKPKNIYRIKPLIGARIFIEFCGEYPNGRKSGILYYKDMSVDFKESIHENCFDEAFININSDSVVWRKNSIYFYKQNVDQLVDLIK